VQQILEEEFGGIAESLYNLSAVTNDVRFAQAGDRFQKKVFLRPLLERRDELRQLHANTHIPQILGAAMRYNVIGDTVAQNITRNFWNQVVSQRSYATGGNNGGNGSFDATSEHWGDPGRLSLTLSDNNQEFCTQYNILMVTRNLLQWTGNPQYADHYERALYNGILGNQYPNKPGVMLYYTPLGNGVSKQAGNWAGWGTVWDSFWCCYASGIIQWSKIGDSIYFHSGDENTLYVNLFISSNLTWTTPQGDLLTISQITDYPIQNNTRILFSTDYNGFFDMNIQLHIPYWATNGGYLLVNGVLQNIKFEPSSFLIVPHSSWRSGDSIELSFKMNFHLSPIIDDPFLVAVMYGPLVLVGLTNNTETLNIDVNNIENCFVSTNVNLLRFQTVPGCFGNKQEVVEFIPLYQTVDEYYGVYFRLNYSPYYNVNMQKTN